MNKKVILVALPIILLSSCGTASTQVDLNEWLLEARAKYNTLEQAITAKNYPFTQYRIKGQEGQESNPTQINGLYTYQTDGNWWTAWDYKDESSETMPHRQTQYEMFTAVAFYNKHVKYITKSENTYKFYKQGTTLSVEYTYTNDALDKFVGKATFNSFGFINSVEETYPNAEGTKLSLNFTYSK